MAIKIKKKDDYCGFDNKPITIGNGGKKLKARYAVNEVNPEYYERFEYSFKNTYSINVDNFVTLSNTTKDKLKIK